MAAQPRRKPEAQPEAPAAPVEAPRLRRRGDLRAATDSDRPAEAQGEVSRLQGRLASAFGGRSPSRAEDVLIKLLIGAASCLFVGAALVRSAPLLAGMVG